MAINLTNKIIKSKLTIEKISYEWLCSIKRSVKCSTFQTYQYLVQKYIVTERIAAISIVKIKNDDLEDYCNSLLSRGLSTKSTNDIILVLNSILRFASEKYDIKTKYAPHIREEKKEMRVLSIQEQCSLEHFLKDDMDKYKLGAFIALYTGLRIGEICALKWGDIYDNCIIVNKTAQRLRAEDGKSYIDIGSPKTFNSNRRIPLPYFIVTTIENFRGKDDEFVLANEKVAFVEPRLMQIKFKKITQSCNLEKVTFHTLRHTFATRCVECECDIKSLSEILGHADVNTTLNKYVHSSMEQKQSQINKLNKITA